jgi:hypothetical protein
MLYIHRTNRKSGTWISGSESEDIERISVVDPDSLNPDPDTDPDSAFQVNTDPDTLPGF